MSIKSFLTDFVVGGYVGAAVETLCGKPRGYLGIFRPIWAFGAASTGYLKPLQVGALAAFLETAVHDILDPESKLWKYETGVTNGVVSVAGVGMFIAGAHLYKQLDTQVKKTLLPVSLTIIGVNV